MNRRKFIKNLIAHGCYLKRHGKKHDIYFNPDRGRKVPVPRHSEIKDALCKSIKKQLGL